MDTKKFKKYSTLAVAILLLVTSIRTETRVKAQGATRLSILPASVEVPAGSTTMVTVEVRDGSDLQGYDLTIVYNAEVITLESWSHGTYLSNLAVVVQVNQPGSLRLAVTQLASPGVSGDGTLLNLVFRGAAPGSSSTVAFQAAELATSSNDLVIPALNGGVITVTEAGLSTFTATATDIVTFPATATRTSTFAASATRTATRTLTFTATVSRTATFTASTTRTATRTPTLTASATRTATRTPTLPATATRTATRITTATRSATAPPTSSSPYTITGSPVATLTASLTSGADATTSTRQPTKQPGTGTVIGQTGSTSVATQSIKPLSQDGTVVDVTGSTPVATQESGNMELANYLVWALIILAAATLAVLIILHNNRKKKQ